MMITGANKIINIVNYIEAFDGVLRTDSTFNVLDYELDYGKL